MARPGLSSRQVTRRGGGGGPAGVSSGRDVARQGSEDTLDTVTLPGRQTPQCLPSLAYLHNQQSLEVNKNVVKKIVNFDNN